MNEILIPFLEAFEQDLIWLEISVLLVVLIILLVVGRIVNRILARKVRKSGMEESHPVRAATLMSIAKSVTFLLFSAGFAIELTFLDLPDKIAGILDTISDVLLILSVGFLIYYLVDIPSLWFESLISKSEKNMNKMFLPVVRKSLRVTVIIMVIIQIIQLLSDEPITSIVAGLGIGGLAVALAAQDTVKHFIGSFVLAGDKPFEMGDRIVIDGYDGPVESIGLRSTRIRTLEGHLITIPNGELANKTIQNIGKREYIRRLANITITYDTPIEKIQRAVDIIKEILDNHEGMNEELPPRVYFNDLNSDSLNIIMIYWYHPPIYWDYMAFTEKVNFEIMRRFNEEGIDFAFPTQTLHLAGDPNRPLNIGLQNKEGKPKE